MGVSVSGGEVSEGVANERLLNLREAFTKAAAMPAPERDLSLPHARTMAQELFKDNNTIFFGETHDDTNLKFLADNPAFFQEAAAQGARHVFIEATIMQGPLYKDYFEGRLNNEEFEAALGKLGGKYTSGDSLENYSKQTVAFCQMAKDNGLVVLPSDFRILQIGTHFSVTSDAFGIPDITGRDDETQNQTKLSLKVFQEETGTGYPTTAESLKKFLDIHAERLAGLPAETTALLESEKIERAEDWNIPDNFASVKTNDSLQFNYYSRLVEPGEKSIFFGGAMHFSSSETVDDHIRDNGYGTVAGIRLLSQSGLIHAEAMDLIEKNPIPENGNKGLDVTASFSYTIHTETGQILDQNQNPLRPESELAPQEDPVEPASERQPLIRTPQFQPGISF